MRGEFNIIQQTFLVNFLFQCRFKPQLTSEIKKLGLKSKVYEVKKFEDELSELLNSVIGKYVFENEDVKKGFIDECEKMNLKVNKGFCSVF